MSKTDLKLAAEILENLYRMRKWDHAHTPYKTMIKTFPKHKRGEAKRAAKFLIRRGYIGIKKPTKYGGAVSLNGEMKAEIESLIEQYGTNTEWFHEHRRKHSR